MKIPFGLADFTIGEGVDAIKFDGVVGFQADGGEVTLSPLLSDINIADFGDSLYDQYVMGYEGGVTIVAAEDDIDTLELAMSYTEAITETVGGEKVGLMDAKIGTSLRAKGRKVTIHPRIMGADKSSDIVIYNMVSNGEFSRSFANEQGNVSVTLAMFPREGMDVSKPGNFFYIGGTDPNATP
ncbi:hypothetical protein [Domibacillus mangrovi]|uniref:Phage tail protein n=1 Tax=Domibacillus mangrovi TaxID=1714354 RepID=A0A1Q5P4G9_9BACI|nr:hypothetical protein [Domibacillus mangrovi]OKL36992.1 hypothetical protein BLL40_05215 [Domibacillus mangrovi]